MTETAAPTKLVLLASGEGTLTQAILDHEGDDYQVVAVVSDVQCRALERATSAGKATKHIPLNAQQPRSQWDISLADAVAEFEPDLVVSAGFMKILGVAFLERFPDRVINTHPALLPAFPGAHAVADALAYGVKVTGSTVHFVDEGVDTGPIIAQEPVRVQDGDTVETLHTRIKSVEHELIVRVLRNSSWKAKCK